MSNPSAGKAMAANAYSRARRQATAETRLPLATFPTEPALSFEEAMAVDYVVGDDLENQ